MLKARELRIGNLFLGKPVSHDDLPMATMTVKKIEKYQGDDLINGFWWGQSDYCGWDMKDIKPIPLTEEWLLKFGFDSQIGFIKFIGKKYTNSFEVAHNDLDRWYCYFRNFNKGEQDDFVLLRNNLKHVHQLQNLYFALTGEELTINNMTDKEIVQEIATMGKAIINVFAGYALRLNTHDEFIKMMVDQYITAPIQLKKIIGGKLFNEIKFRYDRK